MTNKNSLEIVVQTKDLVHALSFASSVVEKRNVLVGLSNIKLSANSDGLTMGATDMDLYLNQNIGAQVVSEGETTVSTQTISDIVRKIKDSEIRLKQEPNSDKLEITGKNCRFELLTLPALQFPAMEDLDSEVSVKISCKEFARIIEYTNFAMSTEETRYNLNGIFMHVKDKSFCGVATDGHRLSISSADLGKEASDFGVIVPSKTVNELLKIAKDSKNIQSELQIFLSSNKIKFKCNNLVLISKLIDGTFPDYSSFIPLDNENKLSINRKLIASAIDRVATVTVDKFRAVKILIDDKNIEITASGEAKGAAKESLSFSEEAADYCNFTGSSVSIGFNPRYISDVLSALDEDRVDIYFKDAFSPVLIKTAENPNDVFVVMPVKV
ncbi:MAG: DNA polymerase III subunit beta [Rickettsiaceae bacterium]|nr:DNA polymerase III subunit beta [Rickettsiaceae bacterium]